MTASWKRTSMNRRVWAPILLAAVFAVFAAPSAWAYSSCEQIESDIDDLDVHFNQNAALFSWFYNNFGVQESSWSDEQKEIHDNLQEFRDVLDQVLGDLQDSLWLNGC